MLEFIAIPVIGANGDPDGVVYYRKQDIYTFADCRCNNEEYLEFTVSKQDLTLSYRTKLTLNEFLKLIGETSE